jgi:chemotaxis protein MotB
MRRRRSLLSTDESTREVWPSFTDVTSTIALILFVLVLLAYVRNLISGKRLLAFQQQIQTSEQRLRTLEDDLARTAAEIEAGKARLQASDDRVKAQDDALVASGHELDALRARLQSIAVLRVDVLDKVKRSIETELGPTHRGGGDVVRVGDNGNIVINESLVFEFNSYAIKKEGKPLLDTLARALGKLLADGAVRENVDVIVVQGHTDERGTGAFNRDLSAKRAAAVLNYLFEANKSLEESYGSYFASSAYSKFRPVNPAKTEAAYEQNRRIEISVVPKDANVRKVIDEYMQGAANRAPMAPPTAP